MPLLNKAIIATALGLMSASYASADVICTCHLKTDSTPIAQQHTPEATADKESNLGHFSWGADLGSAVDLTANDMTSVNIHGYFGYKGPWLRFLGVGAGINSMLNNASRCYPIYAMLRTSFSPQPKLCFLDLRLGISINNILDYSSQTNLYSSVGLGVTLAKGKKFSSHIILSYDFMPTRPYTVYTEEPDTNTSGEVFDGEDTPTKIVAKRENFPNLHYVAIRIGCSF